MAKRGPKNGTLARLERQLGEIDGLRDRVIDQIRRAVAHLTAGSAAPMAGLDLDDSPVSGRRRQPTTTTPRARRRVSPAVRARLSQLAKARWAKAKKEGKTRLGS